MQPFTFVETQANFNASHRTNSDFKISSRKYGLKNKELLVLLPIYFTERCLPLKNKLRFLNFPWGLGVYWYKIKAPTENSTKYCLSFVVLLARGGVRLYQHHIQK
jgi:hypothetical protein